MLRINSALGTRARYVANVCITISAADLRIIEIGRATARSFGPSYVLTRIASLTATSITKSVRLYAEFDR